MAAPSEKLEVSIQAVPTSIAFGILAVVVFCSCGRVYEGVLG